MKLNTSQPGVTIIELLVAISIIAILAAGLFTVGKHVNTQAKEKLAKCTIETLVAALEEFHEYGYNSYSFPPDCNGFTKQELAAELKKFVGTSGTPAISGQFDADKTYAGSSALYFCLNRIPPSKKVLDSIDTSLLSNKDINNGDLKITIGAQTYPLIRIVDPWGRALHYDYYDETELNLKKREKTERNFPLIISAGPDKKLGTKDDITSE